MKRKVLFALSLVAMLFCVSSSAFAGIIEDAMATDRTTWNFGSSSVKADNSTMYFYLDKNLGLARWDTSRGYGSFEVDCTLPATIQVEGKDYVVVSTSGTTYWYSNYDPVPVRRLYLPETIRELGRYSFNGFSNMQVLDLPKNLEEVKDYAFTGTQNLWLYVHGEHAPILAENLGSSYRDGKDVKNTLKIMIEADNGQDKAIQTFNEFRLHDEWRKYHTCLSCVVPTFNSIVVKDLEAGSLGYAIVADLVAENNNADDVRTYSQVNYLKVENGTMNEDDWFAIRQLRNLVMLDLSGVTLKEVPESALEDCWYLQRVYLPNSVETIKDYAFQNTGVGSYSYEKNGVWEETFKLPTELKTIGTSAFHNCDSLYSITIPSGVKTIPSSCFYRSRTLHNVELPSGLEKLRSSAFAYCDLFSVNIPGVKEIESSAFTENKNLKSVVFNEGTEIIGGSAFSSCESLGSIVTPSTLKIIERSAFNSCNNDDFTVALNEGLEEVHDAAFASTGLREITIPSSVLWFGGCPLNSCKQLTKIVSMPIIPPTLLDMYSRNVCPINESYAHDVTLEVPEWSIQEYMTTPLWLLFQDKTKAAVEMPQNIYINKEFAFKFKSNKEGYKPNIKLMGNNVKTDDGFGHTKYERGNLTVSAVSTLNVDNFELIASPFAKYYSDYDHSNGYDYDNYQTEYNPTSVVLHGHLNIDNANIKLQLYNDLWQFVNFGSTGVRLKDLIPADEDTQFAVRRYDSELRAEFGDGADVNPWVKVLDPEEVLGAVAIKCYNSKTSSNKPVEFSVQVPSPYNYFVSGLISHEFVNYWAPQNPEAVSHAGWFLVGNPYPCYYDSRWITNTDPDLNQYMRILVWNSYRKKYDAYSIEDDSYVLSPFESFFYQASMKGEKLEYDTDGRQTFRNPRQVTEAKVRGAVSTDRRIFNIVIANDEDNDRTRVVLNEKATYGYEIGKDVTKFQAEDNVLQLWTENGSDRYAINERPEGNGSVELAMSIAKSGKHTLSLNEKNCNIPAFVEDRLTGKVEAISGGNSYEFAAEAGTIRGRFCVFFGENPTGIIDVNSNSDAIATYNLSGQRVNGNARGFVISKGKKVYNK